MNTSPQISQWWETLRAGMGGAGKAAGLLFQYIPQNRTLDPCFPKNAGFEDIPSRVVEHLCQAAQGQRLVALMPDDLTPRIVTAEQPDILRRPPEEVQRQAQRLVSGMMAQIRLYMQQSQAEQRAGEQRLRGMFRGRGEPSAADALLRSVYSAHQAAALANAIVRMPIAQALQGETDDLVWQAAVLSAQAAAFLSQSLRDEQEEAERQKARERSRQYMTAEIMAQQEQAVHRDIPASTASSGAIFSSLRAALAEAEPPEPEPEPTIQEKAQANGLLHRLHRSQQTGGRAAVRQQIDSVVSGRAVCAPQTPAFSQPEPAPPERGPSEGRGAMLGSALRQFAQYAAGEAPLSVKHVETGRLCRTFLAMAGEEGLAPQDMGLSSAEYAAVLGTIQLGLVVKRGLEASDALLSGRALTLEKKFLALRDYLSMKAVEQVLLPHVTAHQEMIAAGEGPISPIQQLMGNSGFSAKDIHRAVAGSGAMAELFSASPGRLAVLLRDRSGMSELARRAMAACYGSEPSAAREPAHSAAPDQSHVRRDPAR